jgi:hypothetical protein
VRSLCGPRRRPHQQHERGRANGAGGTIICPLAAGARADDPGRVEMIFYEPSARRFLGGGILDSATCPGARRPWSSRSASHRPLHGASTIRRGSSRRGRPRPTEREGNAGETIGPDVERQVLDATDVGVDGSMPVRANQRGVVRERQRLAGLLAGGRDACSDR